MVKQRRLIHSMIYILLLAGSFIMLGPLVWTLSTSLKSQQHVFDIPPQWIPDPLTWLNYKDVWAKAPLLYGFMNSAIVV
ncbi:sugar ABC transporter permease, partial [Rhodospirillum rubrum]|nr:sugar ABC transporter permease [Rhodospirillum rubrum]